MEMEKSTFLTAIVVIALGRRTLHLSCFIDIVPLETPSVLGHEEAWIFIILTLLMTNTKSLDVKQCLSTGI